MSLRLPSQNKFRPTVKKPAARPAQATRPGPSNQKAPAPPAPSSQTNAGPSSSQATATSTPAAAAAAAGPSSSQTAVAGPGRSSSALQISQTSTIVPSQLPPPPKSQAGPHPKPISSAQIQAIRTSKPTSTSEEQSTASEAGNLSNSPGPSELPAARASIPPPPAAPTKTVQVPSQTEAGAVDVSDSRNAEASSSTPAPPSRPNPPAQKLSLLDAARNHSSNAPSPGSIRRGTPSVSARSMRAPSMTPAPGRAPSVTPQPQRAPSASPHPQKAPSASPQPHDQRPPSVNAQRQREPSSTPQPPAASSSFPPLLDGSTAPTQSFGLPPSLGTTTAAGPSRAPSVTPAPPDTAALAAVLVNSITGPPVPARPARKGKRRVVKGRAQPAKGSVADNESSQQQASRSRRPQSTARPSRATTEDRGMSEEEESQDESGDEDDAEDGELDENGKRKSGSDPNKGSRSSKRARIKRPKPPAVATISLREIEVDEMVGDKVDEVVITMGDLATTLAAQGKVTQRAIKIDEYKRTESLKKREASRLRAEHKWRRNQIQRRKVRATKNRERARRRERYGQLGMDEGAVSPDEEDSDEEYEPEPERLTPESTPEPDHGRMNSQAPERAEGEDGDDVETVQGREDWEMDLEADNGDGEEGDFADGASQAGGSLFSGAGFGGAGQDDGAAQAAEDEDMAALRAAGFFVTEDQQTGDHGEDGDEYDEDDEPWLRGEEPDIEGYRQALEQRRRRVIEDHDRDDQEIVEVDDETRFINSASFSKATRPQRWTMVETELFYQVLEETGENYTLMKAYFPGRTVKQLKLKGLRENKSNPDKMTAAIMARKPLDKEYLTKSAGYDPTRAWDREEALFEEARVDADKLKRMDSQRPGEGDGDEAGVDVDGEMGDITFDDEDGYKDDGEDKNDDGDDDKEDDGEGNVDGEGYHDDKSGDEEVYE
ncbi:hypothetical protein IAT40_006212 [Kwoniella sp. CBS 6097]